MSNADFDNKLKSISKQSGIVFIGKVGFQIISFFSSVLLARILGATLLGRYQLGLVTIQILSTFSIMGFDRGVVRFIPVFNLDDKGKIKKLLRDNIVIALFVSIGLGILLYFHSPFIAIELFHSHDLIDVLKLYSTCIPVITLFNLGLASLRACKRADIGSNFENILVPIIFIVLIFLILLLGGKLFEVIVARIISRILGIGCILYFMFRNFSTIFNSKSKTYNLKKYFFYSLPLLLVSLLYFMIGKINILMLGYFLDSNEVGIYTILVSITTPGIFGLQSVNAIFAPHISELFEKNDIEQLKRLLKTLTKWIFYFSLFVFALIVIFKFELLKIYGNSFTSGTRALIILAFGQLVNASAGSTGAVLLMTGKQKWEVLNSICTLILNIFANIIFIPKYGIEGAAISFTLSITIVNILKLLETYIEFKIHPYNIKFIKGTIAITLAAAVGIFFHRFLCLLHLNFILILIFGIILVFLIIFFILYLLKFDEEDKVILKKLIQKYKPDR